MINKNSRYNLGGVTETSLGFYEWWNKSIIQKDGTDIIYVMEKKYENRPDLLGELFYKNSRLWWIICQYNSILDPDIELVEGKLLYIPSINRIRSIKNIEDSLIPSKRIKYGKTTK